ncbi:MAG: MMPL family transporter [Clostridia bacterium]|nr:MMPL family transporter [Clostridia bacterium]
MFDALWNKLGKGIYKCRYLLFVLFIALFIGSAYFQNFTPIFFYTQKDPNLIREVFPEDDSFVVLYENSEEKNAVLFQNELKKDERVKEIRSYHTTFNTALTPQELVSQFTVGSVSIGEILVNAVYYLYENNGFLADTNPVALFNFMTSPAVWSDSAVIGSFNEAQKESIFALADLLNAMRENATLSAEQTAMLARLTQDDYSLIDLATRTQIGLSDEAAARIFPLLCPELTPSHAHVFYAFYLGNTKTISTALTIDDAFGYLSKTIATDERFSALMTSSVKMILRLGNALIATGKAQLKGDVYSRIVFTLSHMNSTAEIEAFFDKVKPLADELFQKKYYFVGDTAMAYELSKPFQKEFLKISALISTAIFLIILLSFKKISVPVILVGAVECAAFTGMSVLYFIGTPVYFIALIVVQGVLMGSTVDYGILLSSYYKECRIMWKKDQAISETLKRSAPTFLTSGLILILVTLYLGSITTGAISSIFTMVGIGSLAATLLVLFVLPALFTIFDKFV